MSSRPRALTKPQGGQVAKVIRTGKRINDKAEIAIAELERDMRSESRWAAIQALIPLGLQAVAAELQGWD